MMSFICSVCGTEIKYYEPAYIDLEFVWDLGNVSIHNGNMCRSCAERAHGIATMLAIAVAPNDKASLVMQNQRLININEALRESIRQYTNKHHEGG